MKELAENIWVLPYSLRLFGADLRRIVTVVRLRSGELITQSTGPFTPGERLDFFDIVINDQGKVVRADQSVDVVSFK